LTKLETERAWRGGAGWEATASWCCHIEHWEM